MRTISSEFEFQIDRNQFRKERTDCATSHESAKGRRLQEADRPDSGSTGYREEAVKGHAYGSNGVCRLCKHVPRGSAVEKKEREEKNGVAERSFK